MDLKQKSKEDDGDPGSLPVKDPSILDADQRSLSSEADYGGPEDEGASEHFTDDEESEDAAQTCSDAALRRVDEMRRRCTEHFEHFDELKTLGFALARSSMFLVEIDNRLEASNCIDVVWLKTMKGSCKPEDAQELKACLNNFFTRKPMLPTTPPKQDSDKARMLKSPEEIRLAWERLFEIRRCVQPNDRAAINDQHVLAKMWTDWMHQWMLTQLTPEQQTQKTSSKTSIFNAWVYRDFGGKHFVMAMWQTGLTWAPSRDLLNHDYNGAVEHVARYFASWTRRVARAVSRHKQDDATQEATRRSGNAKGQHGLTQEELNNRKERNTAQRDFYWTQELVKRLEVAEGKSRGKGKQKNKRGASEHTIKPKHWHEMTRLEQWWVNQYYNGSLRRRMNNAEAKCHKVEARPFFIGDED